MVQVQDVLHHLAHGQELLLHPGQIGFRVLISAHLVQHTVHQKQRCGDGGLELMGGGAQEDFLTLVLLRQLPVLLLQLHIALPDLLVEIVQGLPQLPPLVPRLRPLPRQPLHREILPVLHLLRVPHQLQDRAHDAPGIHAGEQHRQQDDHGPQHGKALQHHRADFVRPGRHRR